ncbi:MAG TPA: outer membrane protein assembly factor BamD [Bacteroidales bacterium]|mgnify:CR=1 FL=1|nr:MAG: tol-pal system protein YbgF [Bacteroidetes bacterium ADurb.Bin217]HOS84510.1 outer membrane protein assembly factor BamD [Bacteroidales bacterium]HPH16417.1 outer membrane protein assembly factor BamD [Bacteroidales bacterium]HPM12789.1 outer membrane protein assembly factor BamD [Bacteroidales bacterium]
MVHKILYIGAILLMISCKSEYQKLLTSTDYEKQYNKAVELYEQKEYYKAYELLEKVLPAFRLSDKAEKINYLIARCYYEEGDYLMAAYYFERYTLSFPTSDFTEEAQYFAAVSYYYNSPKFSLDQTYTVKAIASFQNYINKYPKGIYTKQSNDYISELRGKLEKKAFENSKLFYNIGDYKAAVISLRNCLKDYPDSKYREEILYLTFESAYLLAQNSVEAKQQERMEMAIQDYKSYIDEYPQGKWSKDAEKTYIQLQKQIQKVNN